VKPTDKEKILKEIIEQLKTALAGLKDHLGEKKIEKRIYKAALILVDGIKISPKKKSVLSTKKVIVVKKKNTKTASKD